MCNLTLKLYNIKHKSKKEGVHKKSTDVRVNKSSEKN